MFRKSTFLNKAFICEHSKLLQAFWCGDIIFQKVPPLRTQSAERKDKSVSETGNLGVYGNGK